MDTSFPGLLRAVMADEKPEAQLGPSQLQSSLGVSCCLSANYTGVIKKYNTCLHFKKFY